MDFWTLFWPVFAALMLTSFIVGLVRVGVTVLAALVK